MTTTATNSRFGHVVFDAKSVALSQAIMSHCMKIEELVGKLAFSTARNTGLVRLEEFAMWANKAVREAQLERGVDGISQGKKPTLKEAVIIKKAPALKAEVPHG